MLHFHQRNRSCQLTVCKVSPEITRKSSHVHLNVVMCGKRRDLIHYGKSSASWWSSIGQFWLNWTLNVHFRPMTSMQGDFRSMHVQNESFLKYLTIIWLHHGSSNLSLEVKSAAVFNATPDQTHLSVSFLMILKTLISMLRCVWLGLELNSAGMVQIWGSLDYTVRHCYVLSRKDPSCEFCALFSLSLSLPAEPVSPPEVN